MPGSANTQNSVLQLSLGKDGEARAQEIHKDPQYLFLFFTVANKV